MQWEAIWNRAQADLVVTTERGDPDLFLWEHSVRVAQNARQIARLAIVQTALPDETVIVAAALYHDAGLIARVHDVGFNREDILIRPVSETDRERGALMLERSLTGLLPAGSLTRASQTVRMLSERRIESIEGQVVIEADHLDEFGVLSLWPTHRRGAVDGRGIQAAIDRWRRQREYCFWDARLNDSFRFAPVRAIAARRLKKLERLMEELEEQQRGTDLELKAAPPPNSHAARSAGATAL